MTLSQIGSSPAAQRMRNTARLVAGTDVGVLLLGEAGTGREGLAREIHAWSPRASGPFLAFTCAGAPAGALAQAIESLRAGDAQGLATLYLDEVAELVPADQAGLFNLLASADLHGPSGVPRAIAASATDLTAEVAKGRFRRDLFLRLCVVPIEVPPLRERVLDIPALTDFFISSAAARYGVPPARLSAGVERLFRRHAWPGNLRELANLCERLAILYPGALVRPENLPAELIAGEPAAEGHRGYRLPPQGIDLNGLEAELIRQALALAGGNKTRAARLLGLSRDTLLYRIQKHVIVA